MSSATRRVRTAVLRTVCLYSFFGWLYVAAIAVARPDWLPAPITSWLGGPRRDTFGTLCFAISVVTFVALELDRSRRSGGRR